MEYINERKVYKMAKEIWQKHFRKLMSFDEYYLQVKNDIIMWYCMPPELRPLMENYKKKLVDMIQYRIYQLKQNQK